MPLTSSLYLGITTIIFDQELLKDRTQKQLSYIKLPDSFIERINRSQTLFLTKYLFSASKDLIEHMASGLNVAAGLS